MLGKEQSELGGCRLIRRIGAGGMGEVYLAEQVSLGNRLVAVKVVHAEHDVTTTRGAVEDAEWHFIREAQLLGQLTHPNILPVYHSGIEAGYLFLVMQYAPDGSLVDAINGKGAHRLDLPASLPFVVDILAQLADALQYTHEHQVIHADVKPSNVLVQVESNGHWHVLLADFGIARSVNSVALRDEVAGTIAYMAPERFYGQLSPAGDQYALGVMAFQLLAGRLPFTGGLVELVQAHTHEDPPSLRAINPAVPPAVEAVILRALAKRPEDRYSSATAFAQALRTASLGANTTLVAPNNSATNWVGLAVDRRDPATARTARKVLASSRMQPPPAPGTFPPAARSAPRWPADPPARARERESEARYRVVPGLAVLALLLLICVAAIGLRSHIDVSHAFSAFRGGAQTPVAAPTSTSPTATATPRKIPPSPPGRGHPGRPDRTPTAQPTPRSSPAPTATPSGQPNTTPTPATPSPATPSPTATATGAPQPTATAKPTQPPATATAQPQPTATDAPKPTEPTPPPQAPDIPAPGRGAP